MTIFSTLRVMALALGIALAVPKVADSPVVASKGVPLGELKCLVSAVYHEARGEPVRGQRAVLDTIHNRMKQRNLTACQVVAQKQQFPWYKKKGLVGLTPDKSQYYTAAIEHPQVLTDERFVYFNGVRPHGSGCKVIGNHTFCKETQ